MKPLTRFFILLTSALLVLWPKKVALACGFWVTPGEYRFWLLQPDLTNETDLTPFYFASTYLYKGDMNTASQPHHEKNIKEWQKEVGNSVSATDIAELLNYTEPEVFFTEEEKLAGKNSFLRYLRKPANRQYYQYVTLSKKVESLSGDPDPWEEKTYTTVSLDKLIREVKTFNSTASAPFLKLRSAYQLLRLYNYSGQSEQVKQTWDNLIAPVQTDSWIKTAALYKLADNSPGIRRGYLLSKVFDRGDYQRTPCLVDFDDKNTANILKLAQNSHEINVILAMKSFNSPGRTLQNIKWIYASEPGYREIPFLLLREINKVEDWLLTNRLTDFPDPAVYGKEYWENHVYQKNAPINYRNDKLYAQELYEFIRKMIAEKKNKQAALLNLYAAHLAMLNRNYNLSARHLRVASAQKNLPRNIKTQIRINDFLLHLEKGWDVQTAEKFMSIVRASDESLSIYDPAIMKNQLVLYTAKKMILQGHKSGGLLLLGKTNRAFGDLPIDNYKRVYQVMEEEAGVKEYDSMLVILDKKNKSPFERFISGRRISMPEEIFSWFDEKDSNNLKLDRNKLLDGKASWYIRNHRLREALQTLEQIPDGFWKKYPYNTYIGGDPFYLNIYKAHEVGRDDKRSLNKKQVIREMIRLEDMAVKDASRRAICYYKLGNAWYNMSWHGKNWMMVKQWWSSQERRSYYTIVASPFHEDYYGLRKANEYYNKAIEAGNDKKLDALCFFMSVHCTENYPVYSDISKGKPSGFSFGKANYELAKKKGIDRAYYKELVEECELYHSFIRKYNK